MTIRSMIFYAALAAATAVIVLVALTSGDSARPDPAACKSAMNEQFAYAMKHPDAPEGKRPAACKGVPDKDVQRFASEIMSEYLDGAQ